MIFYFSSFVHDLHNPRPQQLDHDRMAILSLRNKFKKDKFLSKQPACEAAVSSELQLPPIEDAEKSKAASVVESRFLSSKTLAKEVDRVLQSFRALLGGGTAAGDLAQRKASRRKVQNGPRLTRPPMPTTVRTLNMMNSSILQTLKVRKVKLTVGNPALSMRTRRNPCLHPPAAASDADVPPKRPKKPSKQKPSAVAESSNPTSGSTFLPSLAVGFIRGDSDSEWSDGEAAAGDLPQRKNRRGQRARKAIWEKKYGKNANHIKKQQEQETLSMAYANAGRGRGRGRGGSQAGRGRGHEAPPSYGFGRGRGGDGPSNANAASGVPAQVPSFARSNEYQYTERKVATADKPMHPSWEAKKRLREKQTAAIVPAQGTRITFS